MTRLLILALIAGMIALAPVSAFAWDFEYLGDGGNMMGDVAFYPLAPMLGAVPDIQQPFQLEIHGLTHQNPDALDIYLIDPYGEAIDVMTDRGGSSPVSGVDLFFRDDAAGSVGPMLVSGTYVTDGLDEGLDMGMGAYVGQNGGFDPWILVLINDVPVSGVNGIDSWALRGVPEPATLSLLALGGIALLRRKR